MTPTKVNGKWTVRLQAPELNALRRAAQTLQQMAVVVEDEATLQVLGDLAMQITSVSVVFATPPKTRGAIAITPPTDEVKVCADALRAELLAETNSIETVIAATTAEELRGVAGV